VQGEDTHGLNHLVDDLMPLSTGDPASHPYFPLKQKIILSWRFLST
jgi:hypothetical protein